jgi:integrase/recombinase XerD
MKKVSAFPVEHRGLKRILLRFDFDENIIRAIRKVPDMRWSSTLKGWHMPDRSESCVRLRDELSGLAVLELMNADGKPEVLMKAGFAAGIERKAIDSGVLSDFSNKEDFQEEKVTLTAEDEKVLKEFLRWMEYTRYSESARRTYLRMMRLFLEFIKPKEMMSVSEEDIIGFSRDFVIERGYSLSFQNQAISAIKLFYRVFKGIKMRTEGINRPRREHKLPNVLSREEVKRIINAPINEKHRVMLSLIYACGLRRCELLALKYGDIDKDRGLLNIRLSKGNKDRVVPMTPRTLEMVDRYYMRYKPQKWLFEGMNKGERYSESSLEKVLKMASEKAGIKKPVSLHWLRHSYATHLLESGTDLRYIQELLGHKSSRTTEIYTHVTIQSIQKIRSPFDDLDNG